MTVMAKKKTFQKHKKNLKHGKNNKKNFKRPGKRGRLVVRNLPFTCTEQTLKDHFSEFGEIVDINLLKRPDNKPTGCGFIEFGTKLSATKALQELNGKPLNGRPLYIDRAVARDSFNKAVEVKEEKEEIKEEEIKDVEIKEEESSDSDESNSEQGTTGDTVGEGKASRKGRLIVRNLSFKTTEENLKEHFAKYGNIVDVTLLRRPDLRLVGCGFVQFSRKQSAAKAIHYTSGKPFLDRVIIVDWAVPKNKFLKVTAQSETKEKQEELDDTNMPIKKEGEEEDVGIMPVKFKEESGDETSEESEDESEDDEDDDEEEEEGDDDEEEDEDNDEHVKPKVIKTSIEQKKVHTKSEDISEGKTVFLKNIPFSVKNEQLKACMEQFGPVFYALVCIDPLTEHSKGTAFVKFKTKESTEKCLQAGSELKLEGVTIYPYPALKREEVKNKKDEIQNIKNDNRNLYLTKEGAILAGTPAAKGVSMSDMERRLQLERWKNQMLRNLNMFVSRDRLIVHNLPPSFDDKKLRRLFQNNSGPKALIKEARVMRDLRNVDAKGIGKSKGYGFVSFTTHEDALAALRKVNNNPSIFTAGKRPIVGFSIENIAVLNAKRKRVERSKQHNPLCSEYRADTERKEDVRRNTEQRKKQKRALVETKKLINSDENDDEPNYAGVVAKPGSTKMRTKFHLRKEAKLHIQQTKKDKKRTKLSRKQRKMESQRTLEKKQNKSMKAKKKKIKTDDVEFTQLVNKYKSQMMSETVRKKWYE